MIYDINDYYTVEVTDEHEVNTKKYNLYSGLYYVLITFMVLFSGAMYVNDVEAYFFFIYSVFSLNIIIRMALGLQYIRTGDSRLRKIFTNLENFAPGFYLKEKENEVIECVDFEEVSDEETKKLFDSRKSVR
ncbi:hypothetical protein [Enterobacter cloacae complex sp. 418I7]|uniref:hypothetical protein n=1 Tax=Enterobacter cloacae complex sp. 418I7 TaxID=3395839 RepID=UPI003CE78DD0